jgi:antitoxin component of MazEF toxin-antitoxin module
MKDQKWGNSLGVRIPPMLRMILGGVGFSLG